MVLRGWRRALVGLAAVALLSGAAVAAPAPFAEASAVTQRCNWTGEWSVEVTTPENGATTITLTLYQRGEVFTGSYGDEFGQLTDITWLSADGGVGEGITGLWSSADGQTGTFLATMQPRCDAFQGTYEYRDEGTQRELVGVRVG